MRLAIGHAVFCLLIGPVSAQVVFTLDGTPQASLCDTATFTNTFLNAGSTVSGLIITQRFPSASYKYLPSNSIVRLPDGSVLSNAAADPVVSGTNLVWNFSSVVGTAGVNHILISEVMYDPTNAPDTDYEWIELFNPTLNPIGLTNWSIRDAAPGQVDAIPTVTINPGEFIIVAALSSAFVSVYGSYTGKIVEIADHTLGSGLNEFSDGVFLRDAATNNVDAMSYGASSAAFSPPAPLITSGHTLARNPANQDTGTSGDWVDQTVPDPGAGTVFSGIQGGEQITVIYKVEIPCGSIAGLFQAQAAFQQPPGSPQFAANSTFLTINQGDLTVRKTPILTSATFSNLVTWNVIIKNEGFGNARNVTISDSAGPGIQFVGFSVNPTNIAPFPSNVAWNSSVIPALTNLAPTQEVTIVVTGRIVSCSGLYNDANARWGCNNLVAATNSTCEDTTLNGETARATIDFFQVYPLLSMTLSPSNPAPVSFCGGSDLTLLITNAASSPGHAFNLDIAPSFASGFRLTGSSVATNGHIVLGTLGAGQSTNLTIHLTPTNCAAATTVQTFTLFPSYQNACGIAFSAPPVQATFQIANTPDGSVSKNLPSNISGNQTSTPVTITFTYNNLTNNTRINIVDTYPRESVSNRLTVTNISAGGVATGTNITWSTNLSGSGVYTAGFNLILSSGPSGCGVPNQALQNTLVVSNFIDCVGCTRGVSGSGQVYPVSFTPAGGCPPGGPGGGGGTGSCTFASTRTGPLVTTEICTPVTFTQNFTNFSGADLPTNWQGVIFTSDLGAGQGYLESTGTVSVTANGSDVTSFVSITSTNPLTINLAGLTNSIFPRPALVTNGLTFSWNVVPTNSGQLTDTSLFTLLPCGTSAASYVWTVGRSELGITLEPITNTEACSISRVRIDLVNNSSPNVPNASNGIFAAYDVEVVFNLDADTNGIYSYTYETNTTAYTNMLALGGGAVPGAEPVISSNLMTWTIGDISSNGAGSILFNLRAPCSVTTTEKFSAFVRYNSKCQDGQPQTRRADAATNDITLLFTPTINDAISPEFSFLTSTQYVLRIDHLNSGAGGAYNVRTEMILPTNIAFGAASVVPSFTSATNVVWTMQFTNAIGGLTDRDGDGFFDDLAPNAQFSIYITNFVKTCSSNEVEARTSSGCGSNTCQVTSNKVAVFFSGAGSLITRAVFPSDASLCGTNLVDYSIRNSGLIETYNVQARQILPDNVTYVSNSSVYIYQSVTNAISDPSGDGTAGNPLVWNSSNIPEFAVFLPTQTVRILYNVAVPCAALAGNRQLTAQAQFVDNCGITQLNQQVVSALVIQQPTLTITKSASLDGTNFVFGQIVADPVVNTQVIFRLLIDHAALSAVNVPAMQLTDLMPSNTIYAGASLAPDTVVGSTGAVLFWSTTNLMAQIAGDPPYKPGDTSIVILVTGRVTTCFPDVNNIAQLQYGCDTGNLCLSRSAQIRLRTQPVASLQLASSLSLNTCGGSMTIPVTNNGSTAKGLVLHEVAPSGYRIVRGRITGEFTATNLIMTLGGSPAGSTALIDLTSTNASGAVDLDDDAGDGITLMDVGYLDGFTVVLDLVSTGTNLDCRADPTDLDFADPEPGPPGQISSTSTMDVTTVCGAITNVSATATTIPDLPDPDIDIQPNSIIASNGQTQTFTVTVKNGAEAGNASDLHIRLRFGTAWTNITVVSTTIVERTSNSNAVIEIQGQTNVLVDLPGVTLDPVADKVVLTINATAVEGPGFLSVLGEVVGDCGNTDVVASCLFTNVFGEPPLVETMTGTVVQAVHGQYYGFDQDSVVGAGFQLTKDVRYDEEAPAAAGSFRAGRIGEDLVYHLDVHYFGNTFSNVLVTDNLPTNMFFGVPTNYAFGGNITNAVYASGTNGVFTLQPSVLSNHPSTFSVDLPVIVSNKLVNQSGVVISNIADSIFTVGGLTNDPPASTALVQVVEPDLVLTKTVNSNLVQAGDILTFTNTIRHTALSTTSAYDLVFTDTLPAGLTFSGFNLGADGIDNDGDGLTDEPDESTLVSGETITVTTNNNANLGTFATTATVRIIFPALVTNELVGSIMVNTGRVTYTSLDGVASNLNERDGSGGTNTLNDYVRTNTVPIPVRPIQGINKIFVSSSQTNTLDFATTNNFTIGERVVYSMRVDIPQGIANNVVITDTVPPGLDFVGVNTNAGLAYPGFGYQFAVPSGGPLFPTTTVAGLVIVDNDPTPGDSLSADGSGSNIVFRFGAITNIPDGNLTNDFFVLSMEFVILDVPVNDGIIPGIYSASNRVLVTDAFTSRGATGPVYSIAEDQISVFKFMSPTNLDAGDTVIVTMRVQNTANAMGHAYDMQAVDFFPTDLFVSASYTNLFIPPGWGVSNVVSSTGLTHYLFSTGVTALATNEVATNVVQFQMAQSLTPNRVYTNTFYDFLADTIYGTPPGGIPQRNNGSTNSVKWQVPNLNIAKSLFSTSETNIPPDSLTTNVQIGEVVTYRIDVTLPEATVTNLQVTDFIPGNGVAYIRNSVRIDTNTFNGTLGVLNETPTGAGLITTNGEVMSFTFTNESVVVGDNVAGNNTFQLYIDTIVNTNAINTGLGAAQTVHTNRARVSFGGNTSLAVTTAVVRTQVVEPRVGLIKNIVQTNADAGDLVDISLTITNFGTATAYDLSLLDPLNLFYFDPATITNTVAPTGFVFSIVGTNVFILSDTNAATGTNTLEVGEAKNFTFQIRMAATLPPNTVLTNSATLTYDSLRGTNIYAIQRTSSTTTVDTITANNFTLLKTLFATSETGPADSTSTNAQIGEVVTFQLQTSLPEGTISNLTFTDLLPTGFSVVVGSVVVDTNNLNGSLAAVTNIVPNTGLLGSNGEDLVIQFLGNTLVVADNDPSTDVLRIRFNAQVLNTNGNFGLAPQMTLTNLATITYANNPQGPATSGVVRVTLIEPNLTLGKDINLTGGDAGDSAQFTLTMTNNGLATSYDLAITDTVFGAFFDIASITNLIIPAGFTFAVVTNGTNAVVTYASDPASGQPTNTIEAGETLAFRFSASLAQGVRPGQVLSNTAFIAAADTIAGTPPTGNDRNKAGAQFTDTMVVSNMFIAKTLLNSSETGPVDTTGTNITIGEIATYELTVTLPESTITNLTVFDSIPTGMAYVSNFVDVTSFGGALPGAPTVTTTGTNGADVTFTFNGYTVVSNDNVGANNSFIIRLGLRVLDVPANDGLPAAVDGDGLTILPNSATVSFYTNAPVSTSAIVNVQVVEPGLLITKTLSGPTNGIAYATFVVTNRGPSTAYDVAITDLFPTTWWDTTTITGSVPAGFVFSITGQPGNATLTILSDPASGPATNSIESGEVLAFQFNGRVIDDAPSPITNTVVVAHETTISGVNTNERDEPDVNSTALLPLPNLKISKVLTSPLGRPAVVGETVTFNITVTNNGAVGLNPVAITDAFDSVKLAFTSAVPPQTTSGSGFITWTNVGPLAVGARTTLVVNFTALTSTQPTNTTNFVVVTATTTNGLPLPPETNQAPVEITTVGYTLTKTLTSPTNRAAQVGEPIIFNVTIVNTGEESLVIVPVTDTYETAFLTYTGSTPPSVDNVNDGVITWTNVGPVAAGASTSLVLNFTAFSSSTSALRTNIVVTTPSTPTNRPPVAPQTSSAPYEISRGGYLLTKTRIGPTNRSAQVGERVFFNVTIANTGDVTLVTVPVTDTYETAYLTYTGSTPASVDNVNDGVIEWTNVGPLAAGASTTLVVNFTAANSSTNIDHTNTVVTTPSVPTNELPVSPQTSSAPYAVNASGYLLTKTLTSPAGRAAQVGEPIVFNVTVLNTGDVTLLTVPVTDTYETAFITYTGSTPPTVDDVNDGSITWTNVGPLSPGVSTTLVVNFTAINSSTSQLRTNLVFAAPTVPTNTPPVGPQTSSAPYEISKSGYLLTKTRIAPTNRAALVGEAVTFNVTILNTGDVALVTVPVTDTYETAYLTYTGSTPPTVDNINDGLINWTNVGPLSAGASTTLVVQFTAANSSTNLDRTNVVVATPSVPTNEPPVTPQTSTAPYSVSSAGYTIAKTRMAPTNRAAQVGEAVTFNVTIVNTGDVTLVTVPVTDTYETVFLTYTGSTPATVDNVDDGLINWTNVGPLSAGASTTLVVQFTAAASSTNQFRTNTVATAPTTATNQPPVFPLTSSAPYSVSRAGYLLTKIRTTPTNRSAQVGESVVFNVTILNTGDVALATVPVTDLYETVYLTYTGAVPPTVDNVNDGVINWTDVGPLPIGASTTLVLNFTAASSSTGFARTNVVFTTPTTATNQPPVGPQTSTAPYSVSRAGYTLTKALTSPTNRPANIGESVLFTVIIVNTGDVTLVTVPVTDTYETVYLTYTGAVPNSDDNVNDGSITWTNVGPLASGSSTTLVLGFTAASTSANLPRTNTVATAPTTPTNEPPVPPLTNRAPYTIGNVGYILTKTVVSPTGRAAQVGEAIVFNVTIANTGDVQLVTVPVSDTYETSFLLYTGSTPATVDNVNDGLINWTDVGPVPVGASTTLVLNFTAINSSTSQFRTNVVSTAPTVPTNQVPVPPQTSSAPYDISSAGYTLAKTLFSPTNRAAQVGESIVFHVTIVNTGDVNLVTVPVTDTYETAFLTYTGSTPPTVDNVNDGSISWTNVGPLPVGASTTLVLNFTAINSSTSQFRTNIVSTAPTTATNEPPVFPLTNTAPYEISKAGYLLTKILFSPTGRAAQVGEAIVFHVTIQNTGDVALVTAPVTDVYETAFLTYTGSTPPSIDNVNDGTINWTDVGPVPVGASTTLVLNFTAINSSTSQFRTNVVYATPSTPTNEPPVFPETNRAPYEISKSGYLLTKTRIAPTNRAAQIGEAVTFNVTIQNTGDVTLVTVPVTDTYETAFLTYTGSTPPTVDNVNDGTINWTDVGPISAGASTTLVVQFTAAASSTNQSRTNVVFTTPLVPTNEPPVGPQTSTAPYEVSRSGYRLLKTVIAPTNRAAQVGEAIVFNLTISNTGDVQLVTVPVTDTYETAFLTYTGSTPPTVDNVNDGLINWTNVGPLSVGSSTTLVVNFTAANSSTGAFRTNIVATAPTVPTNAPPVPPTTTNAPYSVNKSGYLLTKTLFSPTNRAAQVGEAIVFNVTILNTGDVALVTVPVTDTYETVFLTYTGSTPATADNVNDGLITWTDVGPVPVGASTTLVVNFLAASSSTSQLRTNIVFTAPTVPTNTPPVPPETSSVPYEISKAGYLLTKIRIAPTNRAAQVGEAVVFNLVIQNTGDVALVTVPVTDTYETAFLTYTGSTPATADNVDDGLINWTDVGPLPVGASTTLVVQFVAASSSLGVDHTNTAVTTPSTPTNEPPVPPKTSTVPYAVSSAGYTLLKTLVDPTNRPAIIGETLTFNISVVNTGDVQLVTVPVTDKYDTVFLAISNAVPASDDLVNDGSLDWANIGPLSVGASTNILVTFRAVSDTAGANQTNRATTWPTTPTNEPPVPPKTSTVPYIVDAPAVIGNFVWEDNDGDGIQDAGEPGVSGASVVLFSTNGAALATNVTGASGFYLFTNLVPAGYYIQFTPPSGFQFTLQDQGGNDALDSDASPVSGLTVTTLLVSGETDLTWDAGLYQPASIGDFAWNDLDADGVQDGGETGLVGVTVVLFNSNGVARATNVTDAAGFYTFTNLPPNDYYLQFLPPGVYESSPADQTADTADSDPNPTNGLTAHTFLVSGESDPTFDAGFFVRASIGDFVWNDFDADGIQDAGEGGVTNVTVNLYNGGGTFITNTLTSSNGLYLFSGLVPADYFVEVVKPANYVFSPRDQGGNDALDSDVATNTGRAIVTTLISGENDLTWDAGVYVLGSLAGTVYNDQNNDGTQQVAEASFANVQLQLVLLTGTGNVLIATGTTDANGDYLFDDLTPGSYIVDVVSATVPPGYVLGTHFTDPSATNNLAQGQHITDVDFGYLNTSTNAMVGDFVWSDANGNGIQESGEPGIGIVTVSLIRAGTDGIFGTADDVTNATTTTAASGYYAFTNVAPGTYIVRVKDGTNTPLQGLTSVNGLQSYPGVTTPFSVTNGDVLLDKDFGYVGRTGQLGNQVFLDLNANGTFDTNETGIAGVTVNLLNTNNVVLATLTTDSSGLYLFTGLGAGTYVVDVTDVNNLLAGLSHTIGTPNTNNQSQPDPFTVSLLASTSVVLYADFGYTPPPGSIGNLVFSDVDANGVYNGGTDAGLPGVTVTLFDSSGTNIIATALTDANGLYLFSGLAAGTYRVDVNDPTVPAGFVTGPLGTAGSDNNSQAQLYTVVLPGGGVNMTADFGYVVPGTVRIGDTVYFDWNSNGVQNVGETGIANIRLDLYLDENGNGVLDGADVLMGSDVTDTNGNYLFTGLAASNYIVKLSDPLSQLLGTVETQGTIPEAVDVTDGLDDLTVDFGFYPLGRVGTLGDEVWVDLNANGISDENLAVQGINAARVDLYKVDNGVTNFYATKTTTNGPGGVRGYYQFAALPYGDYYVVITLSTVPANLVVPTTPITYTRNIGPPKSIQDADFGFLPVNPKAVQLTYFRGEVVDGVVALRWGTALELNTLGFNILRAETSDGDRVSLNDAILPGLGAESGYEYQFNDASAQQGALYYYWLEEVENNYHKTQYGPVVLSVGDLPPGPLASFIAQTAGVYRITYDTLAQSGLPAGQIAPDRIKILVNGEEASLFVAASGTAMKHGDFVLFYAPEGIGDQEITVATGPGALRMDWVYVEPTDADGETWHGTASGGALLFSTSGDVARYLLTDFDAPPVWIFDVTDAYHPKFLFGEAELPVTHGLGVYFSYYPGHTARLAAFQDRALHEVLYVTPR